MTQSYQPAPPAVPGRPRARGPVRQPRRAVHRLPHRRVHPGRELRPRARAGGSGPSSVVAGDIGPELRSRACGIVAVLPRDPRHLAAVLPVLLAEERPDAGHEGHAGPRRPRRRRRPIGWGTGLRPAVRLLRQPARLLHRVHLDPGRQAQARLVRPDRRHLRRQGVRATSTRGRTRPLGRSRRPAHRASARPRLRRPASPPASRRGSGRPPCARSAACAPRARGRG